MKRLSMFHVRRILNGLCKGNRKPLQGLIRKLLKDGSCGCWKEEELLRLQAITHFCLEHDYVRDGQDLIRFAGFDMLLPESKFQIVAPLIEKGDEAFVLEAFNGIADAASLERASEAKSRLLLNAAAKATEWGKDTIALSVYRAALSCEAQLDQEHTHPLLLAARGNPLLGKAYRDFYEEHYASRFRHYKDGYLEELVLLGDPHFIRLALECNGNVHAPTSTGQSLLDIAPNDDVRGLLQAYGGQAGDRKIHLLRQAMIAIVNGGVDHQVMQEIFSDPEPLTAYSFYETDYPTISRIQWDLLLTAAKHRSVPALTYMMPYLQSKPEDAELSKLLTALFGVDTMARAPQTKDSAKQIIDVLELLHSHQIAFTDPWKWDKEEYRMTAALNSKVGQILNLACYNPENDSQYPEEDFVKIAMLLWKIGRIYGTAEGAREMLLLGITHQKKCLLDACLWEFDYDFSLLDTHKTTTVWNIVGNELGTYETAKDLLDFAIRNGADINHQTADGLTALHAAYQYGHTVDYSPVTLLLEAGADPSIQDRFGRKPKEVPAEKFAFLSDGFGWHGKLKQRKWRKYAWEISKFF